MKENIMVLTKTTTNNIGIRRLMRRAKNSLKLKDLFEIEVLMMPVIRKPESTKNTSTPINPPGRKLNPAWFNITSRTAIDLRPSMSYLYFKIYIRFMGVYV